MSCRCAFCPALCLAARVKNHSVHRCRTHASEKYLAWMTRIEARSDYTTSWLADRDRLLKSRGIPEETGGEGY